MMWDTLRATRRSIVAGFLGSVPTAPSVAPIAFPAFTAAPGKIGHDAASVRDFGAVGDGLTDDSDAFRRAVAAARYLFVPPGRYRLGSTVKLASGQRIFGAGKSAWEPYGEATFPPIVRSEILIDGMLAFDAAGSNSTTIEGLAIKAVGGRQSRWGWPSGQQKDAIGVDITGSSQFEARDVSFHGLDVAIDANQRAGSPDTQMPSVSDWSATDCRRVFRFGTPASKVYTVRDARIGEATVTIHCDTVIEAHRCDGLRLENLRLFHGTGTTVYIRDTAFVTLSAVTVFETGGDQLVLEDCSYVSAAGLLLARAGGYRGEPPYPQRVALTLNRCNDVHIGAEIQQPTGGAITVNGCANVDLGCAVGIPFWRTGNQNLLSGAVTIRDSTAIHLRGSFGGLGRDYWVSVWADATSAQTLSGSITSDRSIGVVRATALQQNGGYVFRLPEAVALAPRQTRRFRTLRLFVPAGKMAKARSIETSFFPVELAAASVNARQMVICTARADTLGDGSSRVVLGTITDQDHVLYDNSTGAAGWYSIELALRNPTERAIEVPADTVITMSTVLI
jgi:hypothetical protein